MGRVRLSVVLESDLSPRQMHHAAIDALAGVVHVAEDEGIEVLPDRPRPGPECEEDSR